MFHNFDDSLQIAQDVCVAFSMGHQRIAIVGFEMVMHKDAAEQIENIHIIGVKIPVVYLPTVPAPAAVYSFFYNVNDKLDIRNLFGSVFLLELNHTSAIA